MFEVRTSFIFYYDCLFERLSLDQPTWNIDKWSYYSSKKCRCVRVVVRKTREKCVCVCFVFYFYLLEGLLTVVLVF